MRPVVLLLFPFTFLVTGRVEIFFELEYPTVLLSNVLEFVDPRALGRHEVPSARAVFGDFFPFSLKYRSPTLTVCQGRRSTRQGGSPGSPRRLGVEERQYGKPVARAAVFVRAAGR